MKTKMGNSKELYDYWYERARLKNQSLIESSLHIPTNKLRHECTNYDELRYSHEVRKLDGPERDRIIAIIKYQCTSRVLQRRAGYLNNQVQELSNNLLEIEREKKHLFGVVRVLQETLFGKDRKIENLLSEISSLEQNLEEVESQRSEAYDSFQTELDSLKKQCKLLEKKNDKLARNNMILGGKVSHTNRFRRERDEAKKLIEQQEMRIKSLLQDKNGSSISDTD